MGANGGTCGIEASSTSYAGFSGLGRGPPVLFGPLNNAVPALSSWRKRGAGPVTAADKRPQVHNRYKYNTFLCVILVRCTRKRLLPAAPSTGILALSFARCSPAPRVHLEDLSQVRLPQAQTLFIAGPPKQFHLIAPFKRPATSDRLSWEIRVWLVARAATPLPMRFLMPYLINM